MLKILDLFFFVFHTLWILFNMSGWTWRQTRPWHRLTLGLTAASWFILGYWFGWGYCLCTHWHWQVRKQLGYSDHDGSYVHFLLQHLTGLHLSYAFTDSLTGSVFALALLLNLGFSLQDWKRRRNTTLCVKAS